MKNRFYISHPLYLFFLSRQREISEGNSILRVMSEGELERWEGRVLLLLHLVSFLRIVSILDWFYYFCQI